MRLLPASAALAFLPLLAAPAVAAPCLPLMCGFTENGKKGPYLSTDVKPADLAKQDATIKQGEVEGALMAAGSINRGEFYGAGLKMPQTETALFQIVQRLGQQWPHRQPEKISIRIVANGQFTPQAHADGVIIVPMGMLMNAETDDQVGWLMAHEFSHLALGHFAREAKARKAKRATSTVVALLQGGVSMSQSKMSFTGGQMQVQNRETAEGRRLSDLIYLRSRDLSDILALANQFFSRKQEDQADVLGLDLAIAAGYDAEGGPHALDRLDSMQNRSADLFKNIADEMTLYTKNYLAISVANSKDMSALGESGKNYGRSFFDNLKEVALNKAFEYYTQSHRPTDKRKKGLGKYLENAYRDRKPQLVSTAWLTMARGTHEYKQAQIAVEAVESANLALGKTDYVAAEAAIKPAFATDFGQTPYVANAAAEIYWRQDRKADADRQFSIAARLPGNAAGKRAAVAKKGKAKGKAKTAAPAADLVSTNDQYLEQNLLGFTRHVELLIEMKSYSKALSVIDVASGRFGDDYAFLPAKIRIYIAQKDVEGIAATLATCAGSDDEGLARQCNEAIIGPGQEEQMALLSPVEKAKIDRERAKLSSAAESKNFWDTIAASLKASEE